MMALSESKCSSQCSSDGITFSSIGRAVPTAAPAYLDENPGVGYVYYYQVAAANASGVSSGGYSTAASGIAAPPSELSLAELRLQAQQTCDKVNSGAVTTAEANQMIRLSMYELYDLLIGAYEDYAAQA